MDDETFKKCLDIVEKHVDFLEKNKDNGLFSKSEYEEMISEYKSKLEKAHSYLNEEESN